MANRIILKYLNPSIQRTVFHAEGRFYLAEDSLSNSNQLRVMDFIPMRSIMLIDKRSDVMEKRGIPIDIRTKTILRLAIATFHLGHFTNIISIKNS